MKTSALKRTFCFVDFQMQENQMKLFFYLCAAISAENSVGFRAAVRANQNFRHFV